jgi:hypothetical protein
MPVRRKKARGKRTAKRRTPVRPSRPRPAPAGGDDAGETTGSLADRIVHTDTAPSLSGGDIDADWQGGQSTGEETVGGSVPTPDQDVVDEIGRALGVEQDADAEVRTSGEILGTRRRLYWHLERNAAEEDGE